MNKLKSMMAARPVLFFLIIPSLLAGIYYAFIAADRYVSRSVISVRDISGGAASSSVSLLSMFTGGGAPSFSDVMYVHNYIGSNDMLARMDERLKIRSHYASPNVDLIYRLPPSATQEEFLQYFGNRVRLTSDDLAGLLTVEVQAFDAKTAKAINVGLIEESERFVNEYARKIARDKLQFAEQEVAAMLKRSQQAKGDVLNFQTRNKLLDPVSQSTANSSLVASLQAALSKNEGDLKAALAYLSEESYQVRTLRSQLAATQSQLDAEKIRATAAVGGNQLAALSIEYQGLMAKAAFVEEEYKTALISAEQARLEVSRKLKAMVVVEPPTSPEAAIYPRRLYDFFSVLVILTMLYTIGRLVLITIREHQD